MAIQHQKMVSFFAVGHHSRSRARKLQAENNPTSCSQKHDQLHSMKTNSSHPKIGHPKRKRSYSNHPFSGAKMWVSGRVMKTRIHPWRLTWNMSSWRFGRWFSFLNGWLVASIIPSHVFGRNETCRGSRRSWRQLQLLVASPSNSLDGHRLFLEKWTHTYTSSAISNSSRG